MVFYTEDENSYRIAKQLALGGIAKIGFKEIIDVLGGTKVMNG